MRTILFDTETTGLPLHARVPIERQPKIIEFAAIVMEGPKVVEEYQTLVDPGEDISEEITKITGIKTEDVEGEPSFSEIVETLRALFASCDCVVAHNLPFDMRMVEFELARRGIEDWPWPAERICTVQEWFDHYGFRPKLVQLYEDLTGKQFEQTHRALDDVRKLAEVWEFTRNGRS